MLINLSIIVAKFRLTLHAVIIRRTHAREHMHSFSHAQIITKDLIQPTIKETEVVATMRILGVVITKDHLDHLHYSCASSIHAQRKC